MTAVREVNDMKGNARDVQVRAKRVFAGILPALKIGWIPPAWKRLVAPHAPEWMANYAFVLVFTNLFPWLMGPMEGVDHVEGRGGARVPRREAVLHAGDEQLRPQRREDL